jgi:hypothetical protein
VSLAGKLNRERETDLSQGNDSDAHEDPQAVSWDNGR